MLAGPLEEGVYLPCCGGVDCATCGDAPAEGGKQGRCGRGLIGAGPACGAADIAGDEPQACRQPGTVLVPPPASQVSRIRAQQDRGITSVAESLCMQIRCQPP